MINTDQAAIQQNQNRLMHRFALDKEPLQAERGSWEAFSGTPLLPRRSPWTTLYEDIESADPKVSNSQVVATSKNIADLSYTFAGGAVAATGGSASISESALLAAVTQPAVIAAIVAALPVVEFSCPE